MADATASRGAAARRIPVVLCFDVEPDEAEVALEPVPWRGFERLLERVDRLRDTLAAATGLPARFAWFLRMDPQIRDSHGDAAWAATRYGDALAQLRAAGDEIGLHPHAWRLEGTRWVADHGSPAWVEHCVSTSFETYAAAFGTACRSVRFGDRFLTPRMATVAASLGARYDLTLEPGAPALEAMHGAAATGRIPSMAGVPREPFQAARDDPFRPSVGAGAGSDALWMIPLTSLDPDPVLPAWRRVARRVRHPGRDLHRPAPLFADLWDPATFWRSAERELARAKRPHLAFAVRSDAMAVPALREPFEAKLDVLVRSPLARRLEFTTPEGAVAAWTFTDPPGPQPRRDPA